MSKKLAVILKLKKIAEDKLKYELGSLIRENLEFKKNLAACEDHSLETTMIRGPKTFFAKELFVKSLIVAGNRERMKEIRADIEKSEKKIDNKKKELSIVMAEKKALENLLEKQMQEERRQLMKKRDEKLEDLQRLRSFEGLK